MTKKFIFIWLIILVAASVGAYFLSKGDFSPPETPRKNVEMLGGRSAASASGSTVDYFKTFRGFLAKPEKSGSYPGVVMIHEYWGLNDNIKMMAEELAKEGYAVLAVDLFGEVAEDSNRAAHLSSSIDQAAATENMRAAVKYLKDKEKVTRIASLGWCFGGGQSLQLALSGEKMDATVIYYGRVTDDKTRLAQIGWPVLGIFAGEDKNITPESVNAFDRALDELKIRNDIYIYPGVGHAFANPSGANYAPEETKDAWDKTLDFMNQNLK